MNFNPQNFSEKMALTESTMTALGTPAPSFSLPAANPESRNGTYTLSSFADSEHLVVAFICNHCPFVIHVESALVDVARKYQANGVAFVGISANDARQYPADSFENMARRAKQKGYPFPYLYDESQAVARAYGAVCTPDFFVYDKDRRLAYRGRFDATRPGMGIATGADLSRALDELIAGGTVEMTQHPSMGCNIKWK